MATMKLKDLLTQIITVASNYKNLSINIIRIIDICTYTDNESELFQYYSEVNKHKIVVICNVQI